MTRETYWTSLEQLDGQIRWPGYRMNREEFLRGCDYCGSNWAAMILSGLARFFPDLHDSLPDDGIMTGDLLLRIMWKVTWK